jgi:hypothetical protein
LQLFLVGVPPFKFLSLTFGLSGVVQSHGSVFFCFLSRPFYPLVAIIRCMRTGGKAIALADEEGAERRKKK